MIPTTPDLSTAALEYYRLLLELVELEDAGNGESDEADAVREQMDGPWFRMTAEEQKLLRRLSADLNDLAPGRPEFGPMTPAEVAEYRKRMRPVTPGSPLRDREQASVALRGKHPDNIRIPTPEMVRFLQANLWLWEGFPEVALRFLQDAERHDPSSSLYVMNMLRELGRLEEAASYADRLLQRNDLDPLATYFACVTIYNRIRHEEHVNQSELGRAVDRLRSSWNTVRADRRYEHDLPGTTSAVGLALAVCLEQLGSDQAAIRVCEEVVERVGTDANAWAVYGLISRKSDPNRAVQCFEKAIQLGSSFVWAYVLLAERIMEAQPAKAVRICNLALTSLRNIPAKAHAALYHLRGLGWAKLGQPPKSVIDDFDRALDYDPDNEVIRRNRAAVAAAIVEQSTKPQLATHAVSPRMVDQIRVQAADLQLSTTQRLYAERRSLELLPAG